MKRLNLGCGNEYKEGWINVDILKSINADIHHNLNKYPYPFKANQFDHIEARMILEHLDDPITGLAEMARIGKKGGIISITVPHCFSYAAMTDIQHQRNFTENSFNKQLLEEYNLSGLIELKSTKLTDVNKWKRFIPLRKYLKVFFIGIYEDIEFTFKIK